MPLKMQKNTPEKTVKIYEIWAAKCENRQKQALRGYESACFEEFLF
jgi:hypothetical protein